MSPRHGCGDRRERGFGIDQDAEDDSVEGCQQRLAPAVPILVAGSVSRVQRCQVAVRSAVPPHHDAVGGERVGYVVLRAERVFGALEPCRDGRVDRDASIVPDCAAVGVGVGPGSAAGVWP